MTLLPTATTRITLPTNSGWGIKCDAIGRDLGVGTTGGSYIIIQAMATRNLGAAFITGQTTTTMPNAMGGAAVTLVPVGVVGEIEVRVTLTGGVWSGNASRWKATLKVTSLRL